MELFEENFRLFDENIKAVLKWHKENYEETLKHDISDGLMDTSKTLKETKDLYEEIKDLSEIKSKSFDVKFFDETINKILKWHKEHYNGLGYWTSVSIVNTLKTLVEAKSFDIKGE